MTLSYAKSRNPVETGEKMRDNFSKRKFQVYHTNREHTFFTDAGIWRGDCIWSNLDDDGYCGHYDCDTLYQLKIGQEMIVSLLEWDNKDYYIKVKRVPNNTVIPDNRGWFDKFLDLIFWRVPYHRDEDYYVKKRKEEKN